MGLFPLSCRSNTFSKDFPDDASDPEKWGEPMENESHNNVTTFLTSPLGRMIRDKEKGKGIIRTAGQVQKGNRRSDR